MSMAIRITLVALATAAMLSCSMPGPAKTTEKQLYVLTAPDGNNAINPASEACISLRVSNTGSAAGFNTSRMAYSRAPDRLEYFAYHEWAAPPAKMIASMMESGLSASGLFSVVLAGSPDIRTDLRLDSDLQILQQDFSAGKNTVRLGVKISLVEPATRSLKGSRTFSYREAADAENAEAGVAAANRAAHRFLADLETYLREITSKEDCSG